MGSKKIKFGELVKRSGSPFWQWQFYDSIKGYQRRVSTGTKDKTKATEIAAQWAIDYLVDREREDTREYENDLIPFAKYAVRWFQAAMPNWKSRYCVDVQNLLTGALIPFFGDIPISEISSNFIRDFKSERLEEVCGRTVNRSLSILRQILIMANEDGIISVLPLIKRCSETETEAGRALSDDEIKRLFAAAAQINEDFVRFIALGFYAGLRHREITSRDWRHIDFNENCIRFDTNESVGATQKNKTAMRAPLPKPLRNILERVPESQRVGRVVCYINQGGERIVAEYLRKTWNRCVALAGLDEPALVHDLRRAFATKVYEKHGEQGYWLTRHNDSRTFLIYVRKQQDRFLKDVDSMFE